MREQMWSQMTANMQAYVKRIARGGLAKKKVPGSTFRALNQRGLLWERGNKVYLSAVGTDLLEWLQHSKQ